MYAVIETGGRQVRVEPGQTVRLARLAAEPGTEVTLDRVLLVSDDGEVRVGTPVVEGTVPEAAGSGQGGGAREYEITLKSAGWYGEGRRAVRIMEARVTVKVTPGKSEWRVHYWRQAPP
mgnify:CR=1 FL=1